MPHQACLEIGRGIYPSHLQTYPNIHEPRPLLQSPVWIPLAALFFDLARPHAPTDRFELLRAENEANRDDEEGDQRLDDDILRQGGSGARRVSRVAVVDRVLVGGVAAAVQVGSVSLVALEGCRMGYVRMREEDEPKEGG